MVNPILTRVSVFAAKVESTPGDAETLAAADGEYNATEVEFNEETEFLQRMGQGSLSPITGHIGPRIGRMSLATELAGSGATGTNPAWADVLLKTCGFKESGGVFTPIVCGDNPTFATLGHFVCGHGLRRIAGCQGTLTIEGRVGFPLVGRWEFLGGYEDPDNTAMIQPDYPNVISPRFVGATFTIGGSSVFKTSQVDIALNNTLIIRPDATADSGMCGSAITERRVTVSMDPEAVDLATEDWYAAFRDSEQLAVDISIGTAAGNMVGISLPKCQLSESPNPGDRDGLMTQQLVFQANRDTDAGDDEIEITLS